MGLADTIAGINTYFNKMTCLCEQRTDLLLASPPCFAIIREPFTYYNRVTTWS